jgi:hypothetical protein
MKTFSELKEALTQNTQADGKAKASEFFSQVRQSATMMHYFHLTTPLYSAHVASKEFYDGLIPLIDQFIESFSGRYGRLETYVPVKMQPADGLSIAISLLQWIDANRQFITDDSELQNIVDEITGLINSTIYKLRDFK